jgi:hypothetical protein
MSDSLQVRKSGSNFMGLSECWVISFLKLKSGICNVLIPWHGNKVVQWLRCFWNWLCEPFKEDLRATKWQVTLCNSAVLSIQYTGDFIMFSVITNIYNKKTKGPTLMELFTATGKLKKFFFPPTTRDVWCVPCNTWCTHKTSLVEKKKKTFSVFLWLWTILLG